MAKYRTYAFEPIFPEKYTGGSTPVILKSSWELEFAEHCDKLPSVLSWGYEMVQIPYRDPITGKQKVYIPDFFVKIAGKDGHAFDHVFEIKPMHEQLNEFARNSTDAALIARNRAKWQAAIQWADRHSAEFSILNESDLYSWHDSRKPRARPIKTFSPTHSTKPLSSPTKTPTRKRAERKNALAVGASRVKKRLSKVKAARAAKVGKAKRV